MDLEDSGSSGVSDRTVGDEREEESSFVDLTIPSPSRHEQTPISESPVLATSLPALPQISSGLEIEPESEQPNQVFHTWDDYPPLPGAADAGPLALRYWRYHIRMLFGLEGSRRRKDLVKMTWRLAFTLAQIAACLTLLIIAAIRLSPNSTSGQTEWAACNRPLGEWISIWVVRLFLGAILTVWTWQRRQVILGAGRSPTAALNAVQNRTPHADDSGQSGDDQQRNQPSEAPEAAATTRRPPTTRSTLPHTRLYTRLFFIVHLGGLIWWLITQIIIYFGGEACRKTSPHIYYLALALIGWIYISTFARSYYVTWIALLRPLLWRGINSILRRMGRPVVQRTVRINATIRRLSKVTVARIPLVTYIPMREQANPNSPEHAYPPSSPHEAEASPQETQTRSLNILGLWSVQSPWAAEDEWEARWEKGSHPFIQLTSDHATCPICFEDYKTPRKRGAPNSEAEKATTKKGGEELRLLDCGHVFHQTCLDPWLIDVSGRCPVCQRPVDVDAFRKQSTQAKPNSFDWLRRMRGGNTRRENAVLV